MSMPEASVNEDNRAVFPEHHVRSASQPGRMKTVTEPPRMKTFSQNQLRSGVPAPNPGHHPAARLLVDDVGQCQYISK